MEYFTDHQLPASLDGMDTPDVAHTGLTAAADRTARRRPDGVSAREGVLVVASAVLVGILLAVGYQAPAMAWGGIVVATVSMVLAMALPFLAVARRRSERVHPRGHRRRVALAGGWGVLVAGVAGYVWQSGLVDASAPWWLTTTVAVAAVLPLALVGVGLVRAAR